VSSAAKVKACYDIVKTTISKIDNENRSKAFDCLNSFPKLDVMAISYKNIMLNAIRLGDGHLYMVFSKNPTAYILGHEKHANSYYKQVVELAKPLIKAVPK
tara:strand:+ start:606 stop:908 length:303 start_codon:yes stop_codon:yes gene_type:complete